MKFSWVVSTPMAHVLFIHATGNVEMGLVINEHKRIRRQVFQERFISCLASVKSRSVSCCITAILYK